MRFVRRELNDRADKSKEKFVKYDDLKSLLWTFLILK
jgi:hypothetical protein